jgi:hypothetical protein
MLANVVAFLMKVLLLTRFRLWIRFAERQQIQVVSLSRARDWSGIVPSILPTGRATMHRAFGNAVVSMGHQFRQKSKTLFKIKTTAPKEKPHAFLPFPSSILSLLTSIKTEIAEDPSFWGDGIESA